MRERGISLDFYFSHVSAMEPFSHSAERLNGVIRLIARLQMCS